MSDETPAGTIRDEAEGPEIERLVRKRRVSRGLMLAARRALGLARRYRQEEGPRGQREAACVAQALAWRSAARQLRDRTDVEFGPGLARGGALQGGADVRQAPDSRRTG